MKYCYLLVVFLFIGCVSPKKIRYVQDIEEININETNRSKFYLQPEDIITINLASERMEALTSFYRISYASQSSKDNANASLPDYILDVDGFIKFPQLGKVKLSGLTISDAEQKLKDMISPFVNDVSVEIRLRNFKITVLGDVRTPGTYLLEDTSVTLFQALGLAGDMNITGDRKEVKIIREYQDTKKSVVLDLTSASFINTEYYYLQQNDVVIVEPNKSKIQTSGFYSTATFYVSIASILSTLIIVIVSNTR